MIQFITILILLAIIFIPYLVGKAINPFSSSLVGYWFGGIVNIIGGIVNIIVVCCILFLLFGIYVVFYGLVFTLVTTCINSLI